MTIHSLTQTLFLERGLFSAAPCNVDLQPTLLNGCGVRRKPLLWTSSQTISSDDIQESNLLYNCHFCACYMGYNWLISHNRHIPCAPSFRDSWKQTESLCRVPEVWLACVFGCMLQTFCIAGVLISHRQWVQMLTLLREVLSLLIV